jgi:hypothetical protein
MGNVREQVGDRQSVEVMVEDDATPDPHRRVRVRQTSLQRSRRLRSPSHELATRFVRSMPDAEVLHQIIEASADHAQRSCIMEPGGGRFSFE